MATIDDIRNYFEDILQRSGDEVSEAEINSYVSAVDSGALTLAQARAALINSPEGENVQDVVRLYQAFFGRVPDQQGLNDQVDTLRNGPGNIENLANGFAASDEFSTRFGGNEVNTAFINAVYQQVLGRTPSAGEVQFYLDSGFSAGRIALAFSESPEFVSNTDVAVESFLDAAGQGTASYTGPLGGTANVGSTFILTGGLDIIDGSTNTTVAQPATVFATARNDLFVAQASNFGDGDQIDGLGGVDTLRVVASADVDTSADSIKNVEVVELNSTGTGFNNADLSGVTELTTVSLNNADDGVTLSGLASTVTVNASNLGGALTLNYSDKAGTANTASVNLSGATTGTLTAAGIETVNLGSSGSASVLTAVTTAAATTVNVAAASDIDLGNLTTAADASLTITGAGAVSLTGTAGSLKVINASGNTGGVDVAGVTASELTFTGGSGNDRIVLGSTLTTADTVVGGAGTDTISVAGADYSTVVAGGTLAALNTKVTGFEVLEFTGATATKIDGSTFTNTEITKLLFNTTAADTINSAGSTRNYAFGELNTGVATINTKADVTSVNVSLEGITGNAGNIDNLTVNFTNSGATQVGTGTINLASVGTNDAANPNDVGTITAQSNTGTLTTTSVVVTGSHDLTIDGVATSANVNASAFTGILKVTGSTGQDIIVGGTGNDIITATAGADTYTGGAGEDTFAFTNVDQASNTNLTTIADFAVGTDTLDLTGITANGTATFNTTAVNVSGAPDFQSAVAIAAAGDGSTNTAVNYFQFGGDTYVVVDNGAAGFSASTDGVIKLTGLLTLTADDVAI